MQVKHLTELTIQNYLKNYLKREFLITYYVYLYTGTLIKQCVLDGVAKLPINFMYQMESGKEVFSLLIYLRSMWMTLVPF